MCGLMWSLPYVLGMWIVHRGKKSPKDVWNQMFGTRRTLLVHLTHTSSPHKAFRSEGKLTFPLQNGSEKRKHQGVVQAISLPVQED